MSPGGAGAENPLPVRTRLMVAGISDHFWAGLGWAGLGRAAYLLYAYEYEYKA